MSDTRASETGVKASRWRRRRYLVALLLTPLLLFLLAAGLIVVAGLVHHSQPTDVGLVLGNKVSPTGVPSERLAARLDRAVELYREGRFKLIVVSGGVGREGYPEGTAMCDYLIEQGIPQDVIFVDDLGDNTRASAVHTAQLLRDLDLRGVTVISQYFHVPRAELALRQEGVEEIAGAHARYVEWRDVFSVAREVPAYVVYTLGL